MIDMVCINDLVQSLLAKNKHHQPSSIIIIILCGQDSFWWRSVTTPYNVEFEHLDNTAIKHNLAQCITSIRLGIRLGTFNKVTISSVSQIITRSSVLFFRYLCGWLFDTHISPGTIHEVNHYSILSENQEIY